MANDKNLYQDIRFGRIVNLNGRVIGSIIKKKKRRNTIQDGEKEREERRRNKKRKENKIRWKVRWRRKFEDGWVVSHNFLF